MQRFAAGVLLLLLSASAAYADDLPSDAPLPSCLDKTMKDELGNTLKPRGVQKKNFLKRHRIELAGFGGLFGADLTSSSWIAGGALVYWITEDLGVQASFETTPIALDIDSPLSQFFGRDQFNPGMGYLALGSVLWSPIHTKMKIGGGIVHGDFIAEIGAGRLIHDSVQGVTYNAGVMLDLFTTKYFTIRLEARDVMAIQEAVAETRFTNNIVTTAGFAVWIPTGL